MSRKIISACFDILRFWGSDRVHHGSSDNWNFPEGRHQHRSEEVVERGKEVSREVYREEGGFKGGVEGGGRVQGRCRGRREGQREV